MSNCNAPFHHSSTQRPTILIIVFSFLRHRLLQSCCLLTISGLFLTCFVLRLHPTTRHEACQIWPGVFAIMQEFRRKNMTQPRDRVESVDYQADYSPGEWHFWFSLSSQMCTAFYSWFDTGSTAEVGICVGFAAIVRWRNQEERCSSIFEMCGGEFVFNFFVAKHAFAPR